MLDSVAGMKVSSSRISQRTADLYEHLGEPKVPRLFMSV